jgi:hypothetical protein
MSTSRVTVGSTIAVQSLQVSQPVPPIGDLPTAQIARLDVAVKPVQDDSLFVRESIGSATVENRLNVVDESRDIALTPCRNESGKEFGLSVDRPVVLASIDVFSEFANESLIKESISENLDLLKFESDLLQDDYDFLMRKIKDKNEALVDSLLSSLSTEEDSLKKTVRKITDIAVEGHKVSKNLDFLRQENNFAEQVRIATNKVNFRFDESKPAASSPSLRETSTSKIQKLQNELNEQSFEISKAEYDLILKLQTEGTAFSNVSSSPSERTPGESYDSLGHLEKTIVCCKVLSRIMAHNFSKAKFSDFDRKVTLRSTISGTRKGFVFESNDLEVDGDVVVQSERSKILSEGLPVQSVNFDVGQFSPDKSVKNNNYDSLISKITRGDSNSKSVIGQLQSIKDDYTNAFLFTKYGQAVGFDGELCSPQDILLLVLKEIVSSFPTYTSALSETSQIFPEEMVDAFAMSLACRKPGKNDNVTGLFRSILLTSIVDPDYKFASSDPEVFDSVTESKTLTDDGSEKKSLRSNSGTNSKGKGSVNSSVSSGIFYEPLSKRGLIHPLASRWIKNYLQKADKIDSTISSANSSRLDIFMITNVAATVAKAAATTSSATDEEIARAIVSATGTDAASRTQSQQENIALAEEAARQQAADAAILEAIANCEVEMSLVKIANIIADDILLLPNNSVTITTEFSSPLVTYDQENNSLGNVFEFLNQSIKNFGSQSSKKTIKLAISNLYKAINKSFENVYGVKLSKEEFLVPGRSGSLSKNAIFDLVFECVSNCLVWSVNPSIKVGDDGRKILITSGNKSKISIDVGRQSEFSLLESVRFLRFIDYFSKSSGSVSSIILTSDNNAQSLKDLLRYSVDLTNGSSSELEIGSDKSDSYYLRSLLEFSASFPRLTKEYRESTKNLFSLEVIKDAIDSATAKLIKIDEKVSSVKNDLSTFSQSQKTDSLTCLTLPSIGLTNLKRIVARSTEKGSDFENSYERKRSFLDVSATDWFFTKRAFDDLKNSRLVFFGLPQGFLDGLERQSKKYDPETFLLTGDELVENKSPTFFEVDAYVRSIQDSSESQQINVMKFHPLVYVQQADEIPKLSTGVKDYFDLYIFEIEKQSWTKFGVEDIFRTEKMKRILGLTEQEANDILSNHFLDSIHKSVVRTICGLDLSENLIGSFKRSMTTSDAKSLLQIFSNDTSNLIPRGSMKATDFLEINQNGFVDTIHFSALKDKAPDLTNPSDHSLLMKILNTRIFTKGTLSREVLLPSAFERVYCTLLNDQSEDSGTLSISQLVIKAIR